MEMINIHQGHGLPRGERKIADEISIRKALIIEDTTEAKQSGQFW